MKIRPVSISMVARVSMVAATCLLASVLASAQSTADINFGKAYQTIRGFGTSTAWQPQLSTSEMDGLFGTGYGQVGLTILRSRIDPSSTTGGSNWATELANGRAAQAANSQVIVIATPWTPPAAWKSNGSTVQGTLNTSDYANYAAYLNDFVAYEKAGGVNLYAISMQNEPDANVSYESCVWTGATMDAWVAAEGGSITTRLIMPEPEGFNTAFSDHALNDSNAANHIAIVAGHLYGTSPFYYTNAKSKGKDVWMTEHYLNPANEASELTIGDAISLAEELHNSMATAQYNAYIYWWTPLLVNSSNEPNYYALALGQFSKFVRPGYMMNGATHNPASGVYVTAYSGSGNYVIVAVNANRNNASLSFPISGATVTSVTPYVTSGSDQLAQQSAMNVSNNSFSYTMPAQSIVTFVGTGATGTCTPTAITPYIQVNSGSWVEESSATVASGSTVNLGPQPGSGGSWSWTGPNGYTSTSRQINAIPLSSGANTYVATYTNSSGCKSTETFTITVSGGTNLIANGTYVITSVLSGLALGDPGSSKTDGTDMETLTVTNGTNQQWTVNNLGNNVITLTNVSSGQLLDVAGASKSNGALVDQWPATGNTNQQWNVISLGGGKFELTSVNSGLALDVIGAGTTNGTGIDQWPYQGNPNQQWTFKAP